MNRRSMQHGFSLFEILFVCVMTVAIGLGGIVWARHGAVEAVARQTQSMQAFAPMEALAKASANPLVSQGLVEAVKRCTQTQGDDGEAIPKDNPTLWIRTTQRQCASEEVRRIAVAQGEADAAKASAELQRLGFVVTHEASDRPLQAPRPHTVGPIFPWWAIL